MYQQTNKIRNNKNIQNKTDLKVNLQYNPNEIEEKRGTKHFLLSLIHNQMHLHLYTWLLSLLQRGSSDKAPVKQVSWMMSFQYGLYCLFIDHDSRIKFYIICCD